jgi:hypothetical protein
MLPKRDFTHIKNLNDLRRAKKAAIREIEEAELILEETFSRMPMRALGKVFGFAAGLVSKSAHQSSQTAFASAGQSHGESSSSLKEGLQAVAIELAMLGITKLVSKLLSKKEG